MFTPEAAQRYREWRGKIPFTDDQIADMLEQLARWDKVRHWEFREMARKARAGYVSKLAVREVVPFLVKACGICGELATHHYGCEGRCRMHRHMVPAWHSGSKRQAASRYYFDAEQERREMSWLRFKATKARRR